MGLPHYMLKKGCCALCKCDEDGPLSWTQFSPTAPWTTSHWTREEWHAWPKRSRCQLFDLPGSFSAMVGLDFMHSKYLGSDQLMYGSCLAILVNSIMPNPDPEENLKVLWRTVQRWYSQHPVPVQFWYLTKLSMFIRKSGYPKLRGKAAEIRWFSGPMKYIWDMYHNPAIEIQRRTFAFYAKKSFVMCVWCSTYMLYTLIPICLFSAYYTYKNLCVFVI